MSPGELGRGFIFIFKKSCAFRFMVLCLCVLVITATVQLMWPGYSPAFNPPDDEKFYSEHIDARKEGLAVAHKTLKHMSELLDLDSADCFRAESSGADEEHQEFFNLLFLHSGE